jgi:uncharacterized protein with NAD-binding domain and iron-sulfur cluster
VPVRVAVLGGGVGGLTAALELTRPERGGRFEVTVYQPGWRLGGKGASGRNRELRDRIEEHGLHVWFGFYANGFRLMRDVYDELGRPPGSPLATVGEAFAGCDEVVLYDRDEDGWHGHGVRWPRTAGEPWEPHELPALSAIADVALAWALERWRELDRVDLLPPFVGFVGEELLESAWGLVGFLIEDVDAGPGLGPPQVVVELIGLLREFMERLWDAISVLAASVHPRLRVFLTTFDALTAVFAGIFEDRLLERGFDAVDDEEWCDWLARHGATELTIGRTPAERAPVLRSVYDVAFGYPEGDIAKANVAAGTATNDLLRLLFTYRGSFFYKMQAGMGDAVFAPMYEVLRRRGVEFRFFHAVSRLGLSDDGRAIETLEVVPQAEVAAGEYRPLVDIDYRDPDGTVVGTLPCWPSEPDWDQLAVARSGDGREFEAEVNPLGRPALELHRGQDFDQVVLGVPVGALRPLCDELIEHDARFREMVEAGATVRTQAFQLWVSEPAAALGWRHSVDSVAGSYVEPLDTYCEMSHLLAAEGWPEEDGVRSVAYFCGVLEEDSGETYEEATERVREHALEFLRGEMGPIWPRGVSAGGSGPLRWDVLVDRQDRHGEERFGAQYWRANLAPAERYVLTPAGLVQKRLRSDESGFDNLVLAGDWTRNGVNGGCVEAAAISGLQAARALAGEEWPILGEDPRWLAL